MNELVFHIRKKTLEWNGVTIIKPKDTIKSVYRACLTISHHRLDIVSVQINDTNIFFCKNPATYKKLKELLLQNIPVLQAAYAKYGRTGSQTKDFFDYLLADALNSTISSAAILSEAGIPASQYKMENAWNSILISSSKLDLSDISQKISVLQEP